MVLGAKKKRPDRKVGTLFFAEARLEFLFAFEVGFDFFEGAALRFRQEEHGGNPVDDRAGCAEEEDGRIAEVADNREEGTRDDRGDPLVDQEGNRHTHSADAVRHELGEREPDANARSDRVGGDEDGEEEGDEPAVCGARERPDFEALDFEALAFCGGNLEFEVRDRRVFADDDGLDAHFAVDRVNDLNLRRHEGFGLGQRLDFLRRDGGVEGVFDVLGQNLAGSVAFFETGLFVDDVFDDDAVVSFAVELVGVVDHVAFRLQEEEGNAEETDDDTGGTDGEEELAALAVNEDHGDDRHDHVENLNDQVTLVGNGAVETGLSEDVNDVSEDGVDPGCLVAGENDDCEDERDDVLLLNERILRLVGVFLLGVVGGGIAAHFFEFLLGLFQAAGAFEGLESGFRLTLAVEPAGGFGNEESADGEDHARNGADPEDGAPGEVLSGEDGVGLFLDGGIGSGDNAVHVFGADDTGEGCEDEADGEHELEHAGTEAALVGREAFREVERNDDADETGSRALEDTAEHEGFKAERRADDRNGEDEADAREEHHLFAPEQVGKRSREERGEHRAEQDRRDDGRELTGRVVRRCLQIRKCTGDNADVDPVEEAAEACDKEQVFVIE